MSCKVEGWFRTDQEMVRKLIVAGPARRWKAAEASPGPESTFELVSEMEEQIGLVSRV